MFPTGIKCSKLYFNVIRSTSQIDFVFSWSIMQKKAAAYHFLVTESIWISTFISARLVSGCLNHSIPRRKIKRKPSLIYQIWICTDAHLPFSIWLIWLGLLQNSWTNYLDGKNIFLIIDALLSRYFCVMLTFGFKKA